MKIILFIFAIVFGLLLSDVAGDQSDCKVLEKFIADITKVNNVQLSGKICLFLPVKIYFLLPSIMGFLCSKAMWKL